MKENNVLSSADTANNTKSFTLGPRGRNIIIFLTVAVIFNLIAVIYLNISNDIYYWTTAESWNIAIKIARGTFSPNLLGEVYNSISRLDVNYLSALPSALFIKLFGQYRIVYILSLINFYIIPTNAMIYLLAKKIGKAPMITLIMTCLAVPATLYMAFMGFAEIGGFLICMICMYLYFNSPKKGLRIPQGIILGLLLTLLILWSNIYLFFSVSFITAMIADAIIFKKKLHAPIAALLTAVIIMALFFRSYVLNSIIRLYGEGNFDFNVVVNIKFLMRYIGLAFVLVEAIFSGFMMIKKNDKRPVFLWIQLIICYIMLTATRMHGQLHILLYLPSLIVLFILCVKYINTEKLLLTVTALSILQTVSVFVPREQPSDVTEIKSVSAFPAFSMRPRTRSSAHDILSLKSTLDNIVGEGEYLGILAHSDIMNADLLNNTELSLNKKQNRRDYIAFTIPCFDSDNVDISPLCNANYMLVGIPAQTISDNQNILTSAVDSFMCWSDIAQAYEELYEYETYIDGVDFKLFRRVREVTDVEKRQFNMKLHAVK